MTTRTMKKSGVSSIALSMVLAATLSLTTAQSTLAQNATDFNWTHETPADKADKALADAKVQIRYDGLIAEPRLNVTVNNGRVMLSRAEQAKFQIYTNYEAFIDRAEIRVFSATESVQSKPLAILPVSDAHQATFSDFADFPDELIYLVRVYGAKGKFDETEAKPLTLHDGSVPAQPNLVNESSYIGYGVDRTAFRNIKVRGASVTVNGVDVLGGDRVAVNGQSVPVDGNGKFAYQTILPFGEHGINVDVVRNGQRAQIKRDVYLDDTEFFYVALGEVTLGTGGTVGPAQFLAESDEDFDDVTIAGRGALYLKGRFKSDYKVTAAINTGEERLDDIFSNLDQKDPRQLLRRLDGDRLYPVYGDDSTTVEDAPTQGRFYVRIEKDDSHVLWGNFVTQVTGTEFAHLDRGLYGAIADINSSNTTSFGERKTRLTGFAADPGTVPAREEYRATGGSVYFLNRQDLSIGSERVRVEIRDKVSGLVVETRELRPQEDYDVDYIQGRILLSDPLQSTAIDNQVVRDGALSGNDVFLIVRYEYTPTLSDVDGYTLGGRATHWFNDHLRIGATAQKETTDTADQNLLGVDAVLRHSAGTYLKAEIAQTDGPGFNQAQSTDGGFLFNSVPTSGVTNVKAQAYRVEGAADLSEFSGVKGQIRAYYDNQEDGFSGANTLVNGEMERFGGALNLSLTSRTDISVQYDDVSSQTRGDTQAVYGDISHQLTDNFRLSGGIRHDNRDITVGGVATQIDGSRTDGSLQVDYRINDRLSLLGFAQATLDSDNSRQSNDRYGLGADFTINERLRFKGEVSDGDAGLGANAQATFTRSDNSEFYLGYALAANRTDTGFATNNQAIDNMGTLTFGAKTRYNDSLSVYGEERLGLGDQQTSLTHVYGLTFNPSEVWSFGASIENGRIEDDVNGNFDRTAVTLSAGHSTERLRIASSLEGRFEDGELASTFRDRTTWLMRNTWSFEANESWEALGRLNFAVSESDESDFLDADFLEGVVGAAYRPVNNDRFNALLKYTYFEDLAPSQQISSGNQTALPRQKSQIFSVDTIYDVTDKLSIGGRYGFRSGEVAFDLSLIHI